MFDSNILYISGMAIPVLYIIMYLLGGALRPKYSHISNSVSELLSPGAPNRLLLMIIQIIYALLHIVFAFGVLWFVRGSGYHQVLGSIGAWLIFALGIATFGTVVFPQDAKGTPETMAGQLHKILVFGGLIPFSVSSTLLLGIWFRLIDLYPGFDVYSFITVGAVIVMGAVYAGF